MGGVFTDLKGLQIALQNKMRNAMEQVNKQGLIKAKDNAQDYYSVGNPSIYERTGKYGTAPNSNGVIGNGKHVETEIFMDESGHGYKTGTFSTREVWEATEGGTAGVLGKTGRWTQTEQDVERIAREVFSKTFT